jgi:hypothetical protein
LAVSKPQSEEDPNEYQEPADRQPGRRIGNHPSGQRADLNFINYLLCAGFWGGAILAVWLYKRLTGSVTLSQATAVGTLAGVLAGLIGFLLSFTGLTGAQALLDSYAQFAPADAAAMEPLAGVGAIAFNFLGLLTNIVFGAVGGLIGGAISKTRTPAPPSPPPTMAPAPSQDRPPSAPGEVYPDAARGS